MEVELIDLAASLHADLPEGHLLPGTLERVFAAPPAMAN
jgi:hypothetical protein